MKKSELDHIIAFAKILDNYPYNSSNKKELINFVENLKSKLQVNFGQNSILTTKLNKITFIPKSYFPEMKESEVTKNWKSGIQELVLIIDEIIEHSKTVFDLSDMPTLEHVLSKAIETNEIEFKSSLRWDLKLLKVNEDLEKVVLKTVCALNNFEGGNLFIGVADNGNILGLTDDYKTLEKGLGDRDKFELHLRNLLNYTYSKSYVASNIEILFPKPKHTEICQVKVQKGKQPLFFKVGNSKGHDIKERFYIRSGNQSIEIEKMPEIVDYAIRHFGRKQ